MKGILLTGIVKHRRFAVVDDEDYEWLSQYRWNYSKNEYTIYASTTIGGKPIQMHRLITNAPDNMFVDHKDGNGLNNQRHNLRICTEAQNQYNTRVRKDSKSGYKGVRWRTDWKKYRAQIQFNGKKISIGHFDTPEEAARAYDAKAIELFGEFANTNF